MQAVAEHASLLDALDHLLDKGVVARGDLLLTVADIELVTVSLAAVIASTATLDRVSGPSLWTTEPSRREAVSLSDTVDAPRPYVEVEKVAADPSEGRRGREGVQINPEDTERGLVKLVLTIVELLRQLMERQAVRRMEAGSLTSAECERLGRAFRSLDLKMSELVEFFGIKRGDLNLNLGPLGKLM